VTLLWGMLISGAIVGFVILFLRAYEQQQKKGASAVVGQLVAEGNRLFQEGRLEEAAERFERALRAGPETEPGKIARANLAVTCNRLGVQAFERGDLEAAENLWYRVLDLDPNHTDAHRNLGDLYNRLGDRDRALREWRRAKESGRVGSANPAAPGDSLSLQARLGRARQYLAAGLSVYDQGDKETARDYWQKAIAEAPGTDVAIQAQQMLERTASAPNFQ